LIFYYVLFLFFADCQEPMLDMGLTRDFGSAVCQSVKEANCIYSTKVEKELLYYLFSK